jgi:hypothetical protein
MVASPDQQNQPLKPKISLTIPRRVTTGVTNSPRAWCAALASEIQPALSQIKDSALFGNKNGLTVQPIGTVNAI